MWSGVRGAVGGMDFLFSGVFFVVRGRTECVSLGAFLSFIMLVRSRLLAGVVLFVVGLIVEGRPRLVPGTWAKLFIGDGNTTDTAPVDYPL